MKRTPQVALVFLICLTSQPGAQERPSESNQFEIQTIADPRQAGFHNWGYSVSNWGPSFWNPLDLGGGEFPRGSGSFLVFTNAFAVAVLKNPSATAGPDRYAVSNTVPQSNWLPGPITNQDVPFDSLLQDDPLAGENAVYVVDTTRAGDDWNNWVIAGGPTDSLGYPLLVSQEDTWAVFNDVDILAGFCSGPDTSCGSIPLPCYACPPGDSNIRGIGLEIHQSSYSFGTAPNSVFMKWTVLNKTNVTYDSAFVGLQFDPDVVKPGRALDDQIGTDSTRQMIYAYSSSDEPSLTGKQYAVGLQLLHFSEFPVFSSSMWQTSAYLEIDGDSTKLGYRPSGSDTTIYYEMQGLDWDGTQRLASEGFVETDGSPFVFPGDPVTGQGLVSDNPMMWPDGADVKGCISAGPFQLQPGVPYKFAVAVIGGEDTDRLVAIDVLKNEATRTQTLFDNQIGYLLGLSPTFAGPVAEIGVSSTTALPGEAIYFYDWALVNPQDPTTTWKWDFDNDGTIDYQSTNHWNRPKEWSYPDPGVYSVKLVVTDAAGSDSLVKDSLITVYAPVATPFLDEFDSAPDPNPAVWINTTTRISDKADEPPSLPFALAIDGHPNGPESITSYPFDLTGLEDSAFVLCFSYQPQGNAGGGGRPEPEDSLIVEFRNDLNQWIKVQSFPGEGRFPFKTDTVYIDSVEGMMGTVFHDLFQFRFRGTAEQSGAELKDVWFVDDVYLGRLDSNHPTDIATGFGSNIPRVFKLHQNYPNPFNPSTTIRYDLPKDSKVTIRIFNVLGQEVRTLVDEQQTAGFRSVKWNGKNDAGNPVSSGVYVYRIEAEGFVRSKKMMLLR